MDTFDEIIDSVQSDLTIGDETDFLNLTTVKLAINRAYVNKVAAIFRWPQTDDAKLTSTQADHEYYDYPDKWRPLSIWKLVVDGTDYEDPLAFRDYQYEKDNNYPSGKEKIWSNKALRFFIAPIPTTTGSNNIEIHGQKIPNKLVADGDETIFTSNMPELNEAIILEARAILENKSDEKEKGQFASLEAKQICLSAWQKLQNEAGKYEKTRPMFNVGDFFGRASSKTNIGNFTNRN